MGWVVGRNRLGTAVRSLDSTMPFFALLCENSTQKSTCASSSYLGLTLPLLQVLCFNFTLVNHLHGL